MVFGYGAAVLHGMAWPEPAGLAELDCSNSSRSKLPIPGTYRYTLRARADAGFVTES